MARLVLLMLLWSSMSISQTWVRKTFTTTRTVLGNPLTSNPLNHDILYGTPGTNNVYISRNKGVTWQVHGNTLPVFGTEANVIKSIAINPMDTSQLLVGLECSGAVSDRILKSTNNGLTWSVTWIGGFSYYGKPVEFKPVHPDTVYTMGNDTLYRSVNFGSTWDTVTVARDTVHFDAWCDAELRPDSGSIMFMGDAASGIWKTYDHGAHWKRVYTSLGFGEIPSIAIDPLNPRVCYAARFSGGGGLLKSTDWGETWLSIPTPIGANSSWWVTCSPVHEGYVYFGVFSLSPGGIFFSRDAGATWENFISGLTDPGKYNFGLLVHDSLTVLALQADAIYRLEYPKSLHLVYPNGGEFLGGGNHHTISWTVSNLYYVRLQYTLDSGATWVTIADSLPPSQTTYEWTVPTTASTRCLVHVIDPLFTTTADTSDATFSITPFALFVPAGGEIWTAGSMQTLSWAAADVPFVNLYYSTDSGATWTYITRRPTGSHTYAWLVPEISSNKMKIRIAKGGDTAVFVENENVFTIQTFHQFKGVLRIQDSSVLKDSLVFGSSANATDGIDASFGEVELLPKPAAGTFDARWNIPPTNGTRKDIRDTVGAVHRKNVFTAEFQAGGGGFPMKLAWNPDSLLAGTYILRDRLTHGGRIQLDMRRRDSLVVADTSLRSMEIVECKTTAITIPGGPGWSMLSLPVEVGDRWRFSLFGYSYSQVYSYAGIYVAVDTIPRGAGFWVKSDQIVASGCFIATDTVKLRSGWNMIGSVSSSVPVASITTIPPGLILSQTYGYSGGYYTSSSIMPGQGYWMKSSGAGQLILNAGAPAAAIGRVEHRQYESLHRLEVADEAGHSVSLYFGARLATDIAQSFELPPRAPDGGFDARFGSDLGVQLHPETFVNRMEYPIYLIIPGQEIYFSWSVDNERNFSYILCEKISGKEVTEIRLTNQGVLLLRRDDRSTFTLKVDHSTGSAEAPKSYELGEVFPNPFNPTAHLSFSVPSAAHVKISIYSTLGEEVSNIVDGVHHAGRHFTEWNGTSSNGITVAAGVYFVRMTAALLGPADAGLQREFSTVRKLLLLK